MLKQEKVDYSVLKIRESLSKLELSILEIGKDSYILRSKPDLLAKRIIEIQKIEQPKSFERFVV